MDLYIWSYISLFTSIFIAITVGNLVRVSMHFEPKETKEEEGLLPSVLGEGIGKVHTSLKKFRNMIFYGEIGVGNPPQFFRVQFDTGSSKIWIPSSECKVEFCKNHSRFDARKSSTFRSEQKLTNEAYTGGKVAGIWGFDDISIGGIKVKHQRILLATNITSQIIGDEKPVDGILGLSMIMHGHKPITYSMVEQKLISRPVFSMYLKNKLDKSSGGEIIFGGSDRNFYNGAITYAPVLTNTGHWHIQLDGVLCIALVDSGTTHVTLPKPEMQTMGNILNSQEPEVNCSAVPHFPPITFRIAKRNFILSPQDYILKFYEDKKLTCAGFEKMEKMPKEIDEWEKNITGHRRQYSEVNYFILGDSFLSGIYVEYDFGEKKVGFAVPKLKNQPTPAQRPILHPKE